jgi:hypothetical protein
MEPITIPSDLCICSHWKEDHQPTCKVMEADKDCRCTDFTSDKENDGWGYWFTDDEGRKLEGRV